MDTRGKLTRSKPARAGSRLRESRHGQKREAHAGKSGKAARHKSRHYGSRQEREADTHGRDKHGKRTFVGSAKVREGDKRRKPAAGSGPRRLPVAAHDPENRSRKHKQALAKQIRIAASVSAVFDFVGNPFRDGRVAPRGKKVMEVVSFRAIAA